MSEDKLSSDEVPQKFVEWLLYMGCPSEKVPSVAKITEICRGQYYMVWRSLMEHGQPKDDVERKRLQVFCDEIQKSQKRNLFNKVKSNVIVPEELTLWKQQTELREQVLNAEKRITETRQNLNQLMDRVSSKLSERNASRRRVEDGQRRAWLLQHLTRELRSKKDNLHETRAIAESLCVTEDASDVENKLDKCLSMPRRQPARQLSISMISNPVASSSIASTHSESNDDDSVISLVKRSGAALFAALRARRAALTQALPATHTHKPAASTHSASPQSVASHTAALQVSLALAAVKRRAHLQLTHARLADALTHLSNYLSEEECELLVVCCERARSAARVDALRTSVDELATRRGVFEPAGDRGGDTSVVIKQIAALDKAIESKRDELKGLIGSLANTERKIQNIRECLIHVFNGFQGDSPIGQDDRYGGQLSLPQDSIYVLRQYFEEERGKRKNKMELSLNLDISDNCSFTDPSANGDPTFIDELKIYLKKFNLEKNRRLILDRGEKIWIHETQQCSVNSLHSRWHHDDVTTSLICPAVNIALNLTRLLSDVGRKEVLGEKIKDLDSWSKKDIAIDVKPTIEEEDMTMDKIKKRLNENILSLQKSTKNLQLGAEDLQLWADNEMRKYISTKRTIDGKTYRAYEIYYMDSLNMGN